MKRATVTLIAAAAVVAGLIGAVALAQEPQQRRGFSVQLVEPLNQQIILGKTKLRAEVEIADPELIDRVEFVVGDEVVFVDREPPYECFHDFGEEARSWIVKAVAWHREEISISDAVITRKVKFASFTRVNRVLLWISVTDDDGFLLTDLDRNDFRVFEDGAPQKILEFYPETRPITMAILIDTSGSMEGKMDEVHKAAGAFVETLREKDRAMVVDFDDNVFMIQDLTTDKEALRESIESTRPIGATSIYDALHAAYLRIGKLEGRKAVILLTDGEDTSSRFGFKRVLEECKAHDTQIYTIGLGSGVGNKDVLRKFAEYTGGRAFFVRKAGELAGVYQRIADELRTQHYLTYSSSNTEFDGRWIKVRVDTVNDALNVRARRGYFAVR